MHRFTRVFASCALAFAPLALADTVAEELPTGDRIVQDIKGTDRTDTVARQLATLFVVTLALYNTEGMDPSAMSPVGAEKLRGYERTGNQIREAMFDGACMTSECPYYVAINRSSLLNVSEAFQQETWARYLSPGNVKQLAAALPGNAAQAMADERVANERNGKLLITAIVIGCAVLFLFFAKLRLRGGVDLGKTTPGLLVVGRREFTLNGATGLVHDRDVSVVNRVTIYGADGDQRAYNKEVRHMEFFLLDAHGGDHHFKVQNVDVAAAPGHQMSVGWVIEKGKERGPYLFFRNHTMQTTTIVSTAVYEMTMTPGKPWLLILLSLPLAWIPLIVYAFVSAAVRRGRGRKIVDHINSHWVPKADAEAASSPAFVSRAAASRV